MTLSILFYFFIFLLLLGSFYYSIEQLFSYLSIKKVQSHYSITEPLPKVSVVVFFDSTYFHSETIEQLLEQNYANFYDIWVVGKESKDFETNPKIQLFPIDHEYSFNELEILKTIASMSEGEILCSIHNGNTISSEWLSSMVREFEPGVEIVKAPIRYTYSPNETIIQKSIATYKLFLDLSNTSKIIRQKSLFLSSENTGFLKSFLISNFQTEFLAAAFNKPGRIQTTNNPNTILEKSNQEKDFFSIKQFLNTALTNTSFLTKTYFIILTFSVFFSFFSFYLLLAIFFTWILKLGMDFLFIIRGMKISGTPISWKSFLLFELLQAPLITISSLLSLYRFLRMKKQGSLF